MFELKNVKYYPALSEETPAYSASAYWQGNRIGSVSNRGGGGGDEFFISQVLQTEIETTTKMNFEELCHEHLYRFINLRDLRRLLKKSVVFVEDNKLQAISFKGVSKITEKHLLAAKIDQPLNTMPEAEALALYKEFG